MVTRADLQERLADPWWRLNSLYWITDKSGAKIRFKPNAAQKWLYNNMWYLNLILKARQMGFTTFIQLFMLDACLFNRDVKAGVIAHNLDDAADFFDNKIKFAFENLPEPLRESLRGKSDSAKKLAFSNGSSIRVGTSLRSGTYQYLHVSEFGKVCAKYPDKAEEIVTGSLNTVEAGQFVFIESTAEGAWGRFYDMCMAAQNFRGELTELDYKFFFYPWHKHEDYALAEPVELPEEDVTYFDRLESAHGIRLSEGQKAWYSKKKQVQRTKMAQEYPSTADEAFMRISEHAVYGPEMGKIREQGRVGDVPYNPAQPVLTGWDLGRSKTDATVIWFAQEVDGWWHLIDYYEDFRKPVSHYAKVLQDKPYVYKEHLLPHDGGSNDFDMEDYREKLTRQGVKNVRIVPRIRHYNDGIQAMRDFLPVCRFDEVRCAKGILALEAFRYEYDERDATFKQPRHDWASHAESAIRQIAQGRKSGTTWERASVHISSRRRKQLQSGHDAAWII